MTSVRPSNSEPLDSLRALLLERYMLLLAKETLENAAPEVP